MKPWHGCRGLGIRLDGDPERARLAGDQTLFGHDLMHQLWGALRAVVGEVSVDPPIPAGAIRVLKEVKARAVNASRRAAVAHCGRANQW
mgnify:CR=1 FL=1